MTVAIVNDLETKLSSMKNYTYTGGAGFKASFNKAGELIGPFPANVTGETDLGFGVWESRANSIRNPTGLGAVVGVVGSGGALPTNWSWGGPGVTCEVLGTGTEDGLPYVDLKFSGTSTSTYGVINFETQYAIAASNGQIWTLALFASFLSGMANTLASKYIRVQELDNPQTSTAQTDLPMGYPTGKLKANRLAATRTLAGVAAGTENIKGTIEFGWSSGTTLDFTLRVAAPNLKLGADIKDPPILQTTNLGATRTVEALVFTGLGALLKAPFTVFVEAYLPEIDNVNRNFLTVDDGTTSNNITLYRASANNVGAVSYRVAGAASYHTFNAKSGARIIKIAARINAAGVRSSCDGVLSSLNAFAVPTNIDRLTVGRFTIGGGDYLNGYIRKIRILGDVTDAELQALTVSNRQLALDFTQ